MVPSVIDLLHQHHFHAVCMPSNTSQILEPLDVAWFGPSKGEFKADLRDIRYKISLDAVAKWELPAVFEFGLEKGNVFCPKNHFRICFLLPHSGRTV